MGGKSGSRAAELTWPSGKNSYRDGEDPLEPALPDKVNSEKDISEVWFDVAMLLGVFLEPKSCKQMIVSETSVPESRAKSLPTDCGSSLGDDVVVSILGAVQLWESLLRHFITASHVLHLQDHPAV